ncbi:MAG: hypothetical protein OYH77_02810 [Pseudomonadota bacterium]|nr:hypothetical protein [Pseudomonadota bacterium]
MKVAMAVLTLWVMLGACAVSNDGRTLGLETVADADVKKKGGDDYPAPYYKDYVYLDVALEGQSDTVAFQLRVDFENLQDCIITSASACSYASNNKEPVYEYYQLRHFDGLGGKYRNQATMTLHHLGQDYALLDELKVECLSGNLKNNKEAKPKAIKPTKEGIHTMTLIRQADNKKYIYDRAGVGSLKFGKPQPGCWDETVAAPAVDNK